MTSRHKPVIGQKEGNPGEVVSQRETRKAPMGSGAIDDGSGAGDGRNCGALLCGADSSAGN